jgi:hypothetical protein
VRKENGCTYIDVTQDAEVKEFLMEHGVWGAKNAKSPMPIKQAIYNDDTPLTKTEHKEYRSIVGSMMWFATGTRYDIAHSVARLAQWLQAPTKGAMDAARRVLAYMAGTANFTLTAIVAGAPSGSGNVWDNFVDSDHAGDRKSPNGTRSHTGVIILLNGMPIHWRSNKQPVTSLSSACAEIYALAEAVKDVKSASYRFEEMGQEVQWPREIQVDNAAGVSFQNMTNPNTKLEGTYDLREKWVKELRDMKIIKAVKINTIYNASDLLTKCHDQGTFNRLVQQIMQRHNDLTKQEVWYSTNK